jgi:hypothetical protein
MLRQSSVLVLKRSLRELSAVHRVRCERGRLAESQTRFLPHIRRLLFRLAPRRYRTP